MDSAPARGARAAPCNLLLLLSALQHCVDEDGMHDLRRNVRALAKALEVLTSRGELLRRRALGSHVHEGFKLHGGLNPRARLSRSTATIWESISRVVSAAAALCLYARPVLD